MAGKNLSLVHHNLTGSRHSYLKAFIDRACNTGEEKSGTVASAIKEASMLADRLCG
jgi:hypothetical protein